MLKSKNLKEVEAYKVTTLLIISFTIGIYISLFGLYRLWQGKIVVGGSELTLGIYFILSFWVLRRYPKSYLPIARIFFVLAYVLMVILTLYIPQERTHILWVPAVMVLIFFLLDTKAGLLFLALYQLFLLYLFAADYAYTTTEFITWSVSLVSLALVLYFYEKIKEQERSRLAGQSSLLQEKLKEKEKQLQAYIAMLRQSKERIEVFGGRFSSADEKAMNPLERRQQAAQEMLGEIAHHWRQPMMQINALMMHLGKLCEDEEQKEHLASYIEQIVVLTQEMSQTVESLSRVYEKNEDLKGADDA